MKYVTLVNIGSGNELVPDKQLPEPMLAYGGYFRDKHQSNFSENEIDKKCIKKWWVLKMAVFVPQE